MLALNIKRANSLIYFIQRKNYFPNFFYSITSFLRPRGYKSKDFSPFHLLNDDLIRRYTSIDPAMTYLNSIYWTPKFYIQKDISEEFLWELRKFRKIKVWNDADYFALTQLIITEAIRDTTFEISYNYKAEASNFCILNGNIDILVYNNDANAKYLPTVAIMFPKSEKHNFFDIYQEHFNASTAVGVGLWLLSHSIIKDKDFNYVRVFQTNGHDWILYEINEKIVKKTKFFSPKVKGTKPINYKPKFYDDFYHIQAVIGLIRYSLNIEDNIVMISSNQSIIGEDEFKLIQNKEAVKSIRIDIPDVIDNVGVEKNLISKDEKEQKLLK